MWIEMLSVVKRYRYCKDIGIT